MLSNIISERKKALLAQKNKLLQEIKYCEKRIEDGRAYIESAFEYDDSSDSDTEFMVTTDSGLSISQLKHKKSMLKTCLQATQELTSLEILGSEVNIMVENPVIDGQCPVTEPGVWREVTADCRIDLVCFCITFHTHKAVREFAPNTFHSMKVKLTKSAHEAELSKSVLSALTRPSDAVEVLRSYSAAHRSRRTTLARLADKFAGTLHMEPLPEGGYLIKCADLLTLQWTLQNRWSPVLPFHHRMVFDLEYMDESYIKRITQVHRQLSDPDVETDERTLLLSKIISICLEAEGPTHELHDSMSSDPECAQKLDKRRTTLDQEPEAPVMKKKKKDSEVMAPPKSVPKKTKPKTKGNTADNDKVQAIKRTIDNDNVGSEKRLKTAEKITETGKQIVTDATGNTAENSVESSKNDATTKKSKVGVAVNRKSVKRTSETDNKHSEKRLKTSDEGNKTKQQKVKDMTERSVAASTDNMVTGNTVEKNVASSKSSTTNAKVMKPVVKKIADNNKKLKSVNKDTENPSKSTKTLVKKDSKIAVKTAEKLKNVGAKESVSENVKVTNNSAGRGDNTVTADNVARTETKPAETNAVKNDHIMKKSTANTAKVVQKKTILGKITTNDGAKDINKVVSGSNATQKVVKRFATGNITNSTKQILGKNNVASKKNDDNPTKNTAKDKVASTQPSNPNNAPAPNAEKTMKPINKLTNDKQPINNQKVKENQLKNLNKPTNQATTIGNTKVIKASNTEKENNSGTKKIISKIPQKKLPSVSQPFIKKVPLRISPRKLVAKPKIPSHVNSNTMKKPVITSIPRLASKPKSSETS